jgi:glycine/D-amino acid oxidase-like deaminating enzyme
MSKWQDRWEPVSFEKYAKFTLREDDEFQIIRRAAQRYPELLRVLLEDPYWSCPFPFECDRFPCGERGCNADMCEDGYAFRYS